MQQITIPSRDWTGLRKVASQRHANKETVRPGDPFRIARGRDPVDIWTRGMGGEFVVASYLGVPMPQRFDTSVQSDGGRDDIVLPNGKSISVKTLTQIEDPWGLYTTDPSEFRDDYGVLVWFMGDRVYTIVGYFDQKMWEKSWRKHRYASHLPFRAVMDFINMRSIRELKAEVDRMLDR